MLVLTLTLTNAAWAQTILFQDNFNAATLNLTNWKRGDSSGNVKIQGNYLDVVSKNSGINGWIVTKQPWGADNVSASLKILNPGIESDLGLSPTSPSPTALNGLYSQSNYYRFYISGADNLPPYSMYVYRKRSGEPTETKRIKVPVVLPSPYDAGNTPFYIRIRLGEGMIYFEYSKDSCLWYVVYFERFDLPGSMTFSSFYYEIAASNKLISGVPDTSRVDDFKIESYPATSFTTASTILNDSLKSSTFNSSANPWVSRRVMGGPGTFSTGKWKPNSSPPNNANMIYYDLGRYIEKGSLEIKVTKFYPADQNNPNENLKRHHVLSMFRQPWVGHHAVEDVDTFWDLHTGKQFLGGVKFLSNTYYSCDEFETRVLDDTATTTTPRLWAKWVKSSTPYHLKITWDNFSLKYYRNDTLHAWHLLKKPMQLRYVCIGRDSTVSADLLTGFMHNQYPTMSDADGPLYSNLVVKELRPSAAAPAINSPAFVHAYQNAARISWSTTDTAVCYVKYGLTTEYGKFTKVLGPPSKTFTTLLANLIADTTYHYKIYAEGQGGNRVQSEDQTFTTATNGIYVFKPVADTYIEDNNTNQDNEIVRPWLYGPTRKHGNYGWMNLMTAESRDAFLQFNVTGVTGTINQATLQLYGRRTNANTGASVKQFTPVASNWELNATWLDATSTNQYLNRSAYSSAPSLDSFSSTTAGQWHSLNVSAATPVSNNYYFVLQGTGTAGAPGDGDAYLHGGSFDSRESPNNQPELIISTIQPAFAEVTTITNLPGIADGDVAWGDYDKNDRLDIVITGLGTSDLPVSKIFRNINDSTFTEVSTSLIQLKSSAADWGDYDMDNDLDLLLAGQPSSGNPVTKVYQYHNNSFAEKSTSLVGVKYSDVAWGNYNHDQYLDILLSGQGAGASFATKVYRGAISGGIRNWNLDAAINLPQLKYSSVAWGDNDLDGWLDLLVAGIDTNSANKIEIYHSNLKNNGGFTIASILPPQVMAASVAWGNFEGENYLDLAFAGRTNTTTQAYQRTGSAYVPVDTAALIDVKQGTVAWGDYDNDGDLDLLVTGQNDTTRISKIYRNDAYQPNVRKFVDIGAPLIGVQNGAAAWGDYDNDGDLDILLAGNKNASGPAGRIAKIYKNTLDVPNNPPSTPANLDVVYSSADSAYILKWAPATDDRTPPATLTYNVMIGTQSGWNDIVSPMSKIANGKRFLAAPGNAGAKDYYVFNRRGLLANGTYYWKVQAVDNVWAGSVFSVVDSFTVGITKTAETDSTAIAQAIPKTFALSHNYPNPFNPSTRLNLNLPENGRVKAVVYNIIGQEVVRLQDAAMTAGYRYLNWDGKNKFGANVGSGTYLVKVIFEGVSGVRKESTSRILLLK